MNARRDPATRFDGIRSAHRAERAEDYCEAIAELTRTVGEARVRDLAQFMGISHVSVSRTLGRLTKAGLVAQRQSRPVVLTDAGRALAAAAEARHASVLRFLVALGVSQEQAECDAEGIEHHVSAETIQAMLRFTRETKVGASPKSPRSGRARTSSKTENSGEASPGMFKGRTRSIKRPS